MNIDAFRVRVFTAGAGAALSLFMLAFFLLLPAAPAHAESTQSWVDMKFSGDKVSYVMKKLMFPANIRLLKPCVLAIRAPPALALGQMVKSPGLN